MAVSAEVATLFLDELTRRNITAAAGPDGGYVIELDDFTVTARLDNLSRDYEKDRDPGRVVRFVDALVQAPDAPALPAWEEARPRIRWAPEPADMPFGDAFRDEVSDQLSLVLVHVSPDEMQIMWLTPSMAGQWDRTEADLRAAAVENMEQLLAEAEVRTEEVDGHTLGMLATEYEAFKAALVFCPGLKAKAGSVLGWPLAAVLPCRDFVLLFARDDTDALGLVGPAVIGEYEKGAYQLTTEVYEVTDDGVRATGEFQRKPSDPDDEPVDEDGMKTVRYQGGIVTFRIPAHWEEEDDDENGGTFYDEDVDDSTLRLSLMLAESREPVTVRTSRKMAESRAEAEEGGALHDLGRGNWLLTYVHEADEDGGALAIHYWEIYNPVPPSHVRIALFSYTVPADQLDDEDVREELAMVDREVRRCEFAAEVGETGES